MKLGCVSPRWLMHRSRTLGYLKSWWFYPLYQLKFCISWTFPLCAPPNQSSHLPDVCYWLETSNRCSVRLSRCHFVTGFQLQTCAQWMEGRTLSHLVIQSFNKHGDSTMCLGAEGLKANKTQPRPSISEQSDGEVEKHTDNYNRKHICWDRRRIMWPKKRGWRGLWDQMGSHHTLQVK